MVWCEIGKMFPVCWPTGFGKSHLVLDLIKKNTTNMTTSLLSFPCYEGVRRLIAEAVTVLFSHTKNLRKKAKATFVWYPKEIAALKIIHDENNVLTGDEMLIVRSLLNESKHECLYIENEHPGGFKYLK